jgi:DNA-binding beta-propeller fold protein YncE
LYVSDFLNNAVDVFSISNTGGLTAVSGSPFSLGGNSAGAGGLALAAGIGSLYATDLNRGIVTAWVSNQGALTAISGSPFTVGNTPERAVGVTTTIGNQFLYVSNTNDSAGGISAFSINVTTGALTPVPGSPFATGAVGSFPGPAAMVFREFGGNFLYVALAGTANANNQIEAFVIDANTGALTPVPGSPFTTGKDPLHMTLDAPGNFLYTSNIQDNTISAFSFDSNTGALNPVPGSPFPSGGLSVGGMSAFSGSLYVADPQGNAIRGYVVDDTSATSTGALTAMTGSPFKAGNQPSFLSAVVAPGP